MILEHALLNVTPGDEAAYEGSMRKALPIIESADGCHGAEVRAQVEDPSVYLLLVRWESVAAHMAFRESEAFISWRALTHHFYDVAPSVTHFLEPLGP